MNYVIKAANLSKSYGCFKALVNFNLTIKEGSIFGLIGTSGAGKSTFLKILTGLEKQDEGVLEVFGEKIPFDNKNQLAAFRQKIAVIFQNYHLLNSLTVFDNIALPLSLQKKDKHLICEEVETLLNLVGLSDKKNLYPASLSGGQKQRVAIARALITKPRLLVCDEPTSALDPENTLATITILKQIAAKLSTTIVIVTHEIGILGHLCDHLAIIDQGCVVETGEVQDIFFNPKHEATLKLLKPKVFKASDFFESAQTPRIFELKFLGDSAKKPLMSELVSLFKIHPNILEGHIQKVGKTSFGHLIVSFEDHHANLEKAIHYLQTHNVIIKEL